MVTVLTRFDGAFFIGQAASEEPSRHNTLFNPAVIVHMPVQIGSQTGVAFQTNIIFLECGRINLPLEVVLSTLDESELLVKHYAASLANYKKSTVIPSIVKH